MKYQKRPTQPMPVVEAEKWVGRGYLPNRVRPYSGWQAQSIPNEHCTSCGQCFVDHGELPYGPNLTVMVHPGWYIIWTGEKWVTSSPDVFEKSYVRVG